MIYFKVFILIYLKFNFTYNYINMKKCIYTRPNKSYTKWYNDNVDQLSKLYTFFAENNINCNKNNFVKFIYTYSK